MNIYSIIRIVLTLALLFAVYSETGFWTTVTLALVAIRLEAPGLLHG